MATARRKWDKKGERYKDGQKKRRRQDRGWHDDDICRMCFFITHTGIEIKTGVKKVGRNVKHKGEGGYDVITGWVLEDTRDGEMMQQKQREGKMADRRGGSGELEVKYSLEFCSTLHCRQERVKRTTLVTW